MTELLLPRQTAILPPPTGRLYDFGMPGKFVAPQIALTLGPDSPPRSAALGQRLLDEIQAELNLGNRRDGPTLSNAKTSDASAVVSAETLAQGAGSDLIESEQNGVSATSATPHGSLFRISRLSNAISPFPTLLGPVPKGLRLDTDGD